MTSRPHVIRLALVIAAATAAYLVGIGRVHLFDRDEPRNAQAARQMLQSGDWVVPRLLDRVRTAKPPLTYWCQAAVMSLIGNGEGGWADTAAARMPSVVATVMTLMVLAAVITRFMDQERAFWTVLVYATSGIVIGFMGKGSMHDALLVLWVTIAQLCLFAILRGRGTWAVVIVMSVAVALAGLTKGPVVLGVMTMTLAALPALLWRGTGAPPVQPFRAAGTHGRGARAMLKAMAAVVIVLAIATPWVWLVEERSPGFLFASVSHDVVRRTFEPLEQHKGPPGYYLLTVWATYFPWSVLLPLTFVVAWRHRDEPVIRFALAAVIGPWVMFEIVQTKLPHYLLPSFPALAFLTADAIVRCLRGDHDDLITKGTRGAIVAWGAVVIGIGVAPWCFPVKFDRPLVVAMVAFTIYAIVYAAAAVIPFLRRRPRGALLVMGVGMAPAMSVLWGLYLPHAQFLRLSGNVAQILKHNGAGARETTPGEVQMIAYKEPAVAFHQGGTAREQSDNDFLIRTPPAQWPRFLVIRDDVWQRTPPDVKARLEVLGSARGLTRTVWVARKKEAGNGLASANIITSMTWPRLLADLVLIAHAAFIAFVLLGLLLTWVGIFCGWKWVRGFGFRATHLAAIAFVVIQTYLNIVCPLTIWENRLRVAGGQPAYGERGFIHHWLHNLIFFDAPGWVFTLCYTLFGLLVIGTLILAPPRRPRWPRRLSAWKMQRATV